MPKSRTPSNEWIELPHEWNDMHRAFHIRYCFDRSYGRGVSITTADSLNAHVFEFKTFRAFVRKLTDVLNDIEEHNERYGDE
jgi:hypothetical protein